MDRAQIRTPQTPAAKPAEVRSPGPTPIAPQLLKLIAGGAPKGGWAAAPLSTDTEAPKGGW